MGWGEGPEVLTVSVRKQLVMANLLKLYMAHGLNRLKLEIYSQNSIPNKILSYNWPKEELWEIWEVKRKQKATLWGHCDQTQWQTREAPEGLRGSLFSCFSSRALVQLIKVAPSLLSGTRLGAHSGADTERRETSFCRAWRSPRSVLDVLPLSLSSAVIRVALHSLPQVPRSRLLSPTCISIFVSWAFTHWKL